MNYFDIKTMIDENFSEFQLSSNFTLAESDFYDTYSKHFSEYNQDDLYITLRQYYSQDVVHFITSHMVDNKYTEPFESWSNIPLWYYNAFSFGGAIKLNINDLVYYLSGFMNVMLSNSIDLNKPLNILRWYDILDADTNYTDELSKELNNKQLKTIALFLCFDPKTKEIDLSPPSEEEESTFAKFWYPFLK